MKWLIGLALLFSGGAAGADLEHRLADGVTVTLRFAPCRTTTVLVHIKPEMQPHYLDGSVTVPQPPKMLALPFCWRSGPVGSGLVFIVDEGGSAVLVPIKHFSLANGL